MIINYKINIHSVSCVPKTTQKGKKAATNGDKCQIYMKATKCGSYFVLEIDL